MELKTKVFFPICFLCCLSMTALAGCDLFEVGEEGCPMAHCDAQMSDNPRLPVPNAPKTYLQLNIPEGSSYGLGCVSNGARAACSFFGNVVPYSSPAVYSNPALRVYDNAGNEIWEAGIEVNGVDSLDPRTAWMSAPIIDKDNHVIAADDKFIMRFDESGNLIWKAGIPAGKPVSPVPDGRGFVLVGTKAGPVTTFMPVQSEVTDGDGDGIDTHLDSKWVTFDMQGVISLTSAQPPFDPPLYDMYYEVDNTPAFRSDGKRVYITMAKKKWPKQGELVALDIDDNGVISLAWTYHFTSPSGASPLVVEDGLGAVCGPNRNQECGPVIYFDGRYNAGSAEVAKIYAIEDVPQARWGECNPQGKPCGAELWSYNVEPPGSAPPSGWLFPVQKTIDTSFTADPADHCMWYYATTWHEINANTGSDPYLYCLDYADGNVTMKVDPGELLGQASTHLYAASGLLMMAQDPNDGGANGGPALIFNPNGVIGTAAGGKRANKIVAFRPDKTAFDPENKNAPEDKTIYKLWEKDLTANQGTIYPIADALFGGGLTKSTQGQIAILKNPDNNGEGTRIVFTTNKNGVYIIGD